MAAPLEMLSMVEALSYQPMPVCVMGLRGTERPTVTNFRKLKLELPLDPRQQTPIHRLQAHVP